MDRQTKAKENLKSFVAAVIELFENKNIKFDLVITSGNTGILMAKLLELVLQVREIAFPKKLTLPYRRFFESHVPVGRPFDNSHLSKDIKESLGQVGKLNNIIFVDDEIGRGKTIKGIVNLIRSSLNVFDPETKLYVLAEDHGFDPNSMDVNTDFIPFSKKSERINNAITFLIPGSILEDVKKHHGNVNPKELINSLLDLPIKGVVDNKAIWSSELLDDLKRHIPNFEKLQGEFLTYVNDLILSDIKSLETKKL